LTVPVNPLDSLSRGGPDGIYALTFSPDGHWLVAGTRYGALHRWDLRQNPPLLASWVGHTRYVTHLQFSRASAALYSAPGAEKVGQRWAVSAWEKPTQQPRAARSRAVPDHIVGRAVHPTEGWIACTSEYGLLTCLSGDRLQPIRPP